MAAWPRFSLRPFGAPPSSEEGRWVNYSPSSGCCGAVASSELVSPRMKASTCGRSCGWTSTSRAFEPSDGPTTPRDSSRSMSRPALAKPTLSLRCSIEVEPNWLVTTSSAACSSTSMSSPISSSGSMLSFFSASLAICSMSSRYFGLRWVRTNSTALRISDSDTHEPCTRIGLAEPIGRNNASP